MDRVKQDREAIRDKIRAAAMEIIGKNGFSGISARKIGEFMGLKNVSLINYYFGSKEELIIETLKNNYFDVMKEIYESMDKFESTEDKLIALFEKMLEIFWKYPALIPLFYFDEIKRSGNIRKESIAKLVKLQDGIVSRNLTLLQEFTGIMDDEELLLKLFQVRGAVMFPPLAKDVYPELDKYFGDQNKRREYVKSVFDGICSGLTKAGSIK